MYKKIPKLILLILKELKFRISFKKYKISFFTRKLHLSNLYKQKNDNITINKSSPEFNVLFFTGYGLGYHIETIEPILMSSLLNRGVHITSMYCNNSLPCCEFNIIGNETKGLSKLHLRGLSDFANYNTCNFCINSIKLMYDHMPIDVIGINNYLSICDYELANDLVNSIDIDNFRNFVYKNINVGEQAFASYLRATFNGHVELISYNIVLIKKFLRSAILLAISTEIAFKKIKPDRVVLIHGLYNIHGIPTEIARKLNIPVIILGGGGIRKDTIIACHGETYHKQLVNESNTIWENITLNSYKIEKVLNYVNKKKYSGSGVDYLNYHPNPIESNDFIYRFLKINDNRKIITIFTNVVWDAQILYQGNIFKDIYDWLEFTILEIKKNKNIIGIIRVHPAEKKGNSPTNQPIMDEIFKRIKILPDNIRVVEAENNISSYSLAKISHASIIYGTKMGLEIALMKIPLIICGETFSRKKGYGIDINDKIQYTNLLKNIETYSFNIDKFYERSLKYAYYYYFCRMIDMPFTTTTNNLQNITINYDKPSDLKNNKNINLICDGIINLSNFYYDPNEDI